ncbi:HNH endonuclease [Listeria booriae]|nr:HNH endonuclease [Listeria booriae]MBC1561428.1 HNH endonuclease [Listeria booriae]MBC1906120.1 HNH endonuclease [Listeria booriae]MBC1912204.1 HNH endonuclease [Listeria booriae]MBC2056222.1 HNH endonuclease [Listeria booriae]
MKNGAVQTGKILDVLEAGGRNLNPRRIAVLQDTTGSLHIAHNTAENVHRFETLAKGIGGANIKDISKFIEGSKKFEDVLGDYAKIYKEAVESNKPWSWDDTIPGGDSLSASQRRKIKEMAIGKGHIPDVKVHKSDGMRYGFADFAEAGVVEETVDLPESLWKLSDKEQFRWLDKKIGGTRSGRTWHHTETPGKMELIPFGIHNITPHNGGRTTGMWADAPR